MRIFSENQILAVRSKALWLIEKIGFDKISAGVLSTIVSGIARLILSQANSGRIDILSVHRETKKGITILAFLEEEDNMELNKHEEMTKLNKKKKILNRTNIVTLKAKNIIDEYKIFPASNNELIMQLTKWI